jgi:hypothetical protein
MADQRIFPLLAPDAGHEAQDLADRGIGPVMVIAGFLDMLDLRGIIRRG